MRYRFRKELYPKIAVLKAAYHYTDAAFIHLDADKEYYYIELQMKEPINSISEKEFVNELLTQSLRHEIYQQTKNIRELLLARAMASTIVADPEPMEAEDKTNMIEEVFHEEEILRDWFLNNEAK